MKIASFQDGGGASYGVVIDDQLTIASSAFRAQFPTVRAVLEASAVDQLAKDVAGRKADCYVSAKQLLPPITNPQRIICVGGHFTGQLRTVPCRHHTLSLRQVAAGSSY